VQESISADKGEQLYLSSLRALTQNDLHAAKRLAEAALEQLGRTKPTPQHASAKARLWCMCAQVCYGLGNYDTAIENATAALLRDNDCISALRWRGLSAKKLNTPASLKLARADWQAIAACVDSGCTSQEIWQHLSDIRNALSELVKNTPPLGAGRVLNDSDSRILGAVQETQTKLKESEDMTKQLQDGMTRMTKQQREERVSMLYDIENERERHREEASMLRSQLRDFHFPNKIKEQQERVIDIYPCEWQLLDTDLNCELKVVEPHSSEWNAVQHKFKLATDAGCQLRRILRIQNRYLCESACLLKAFSCALAEG
jgi:hypothetical protein